MKRLSLFSMLNIRPGEGRLVGWMLIFALLMGLPSLMTETAAYSLFLAEFGAQAIPYVYIGFALVTTGSGVIYTFLEKRVRFSKFLTVNLLVLGLSLCLFWFFLWISQARWSRMALAIWYESAWALANLGFWSLAVRMFNIRQSKRLFGLIGIGLTLSESISGFLVPWLVRLVGTSNLLLIAAASYGGALVVQSYILRSLAATFTTPLAESEEYEAKKNQSTLIDLFKNHYVVLIFAFAALYALVFYALDNAFYDRIETRFSDADQLASFLGVFFGLAGLLTMVAGAFLSGRFLSRYGLRGGLLVMPVIILVGAFLTAIVGTFFEALVILFWLVVITRLLNEVLAYTINRAAWQVLYEPLPQNQQLRAQTVVESMIKPLAGGLAGVLLLALSAFFRLNAVEISYLLLIILAAWLGVVMMLNRLYPTVLLQALTRRRLNEISFVPDKSGVAILKQGLKSPHVGVVIYALNMLEEIEPETLPMMMETLLHHPADEIRMNALHRIERFELDSAIPVVRQTLKSDPSPAVRSVSLRTLAHLGGSQVYDEIYPYLEDPDPMLRLGAMVGLLRNNGQKGRTGTPQVSDRLVELVNSSNPADRKFAARVIFETEIQAFSPLLRQLLTDDNVEVQQAALATAKKLRNPELWSTVIDRLALPKARTAAMATLASGDVEVLPELMSAFTRPGQSREVLIRLARIFGRIRGPETIAFLRSHLNFPDAQIRFYILASLSQCGYRAQGEQRPLIEQAILAETAHATWLLAAWVDLGQDEAVALLKSALENELSQHLARIFSLLSFIYDSPTILQIGNSLGLAPHYSVKQVIAEKQAYALEIVEMLVSAELRMVLLPLIDDLSPHQRLEVLQGHFPQQSLPLEQRLREIISGSDTWFNPWTKACALHIVAQLSLSSLAEDVTLALHGSVPLVRDTAARTLFKVAPERYDSYVENLPQSPGLQSKKAGDCLTTTQKRKNWMLSLIEKVIFLKGVSLFSETPEEVLAELAAVLEDLDLPPGETIIEQGEPGSSLYIIIDGQVKVHEGPRTLTTLGARDVFGELAILDPGPRSASVTTLEKSRLLRLDREPFQELIDDHSVVSRRIMQILVQQLRYVYREARLNRPADMLLDHVKQP
jgi:ATP/ADP translocase/HEAT repeat protein